MHRLAYVIVNHRYLDVQRTADFDELNENWQKPGFYLNLTVCNSQTQLLELFPKLHRVECKYKHRFWQFSFSSSKSAVRRTSWYLWLTITLADLCTYSIYDCEVILLHNVASSCKLETRVQKHHYTTSLLIFLLKIEKSRWMCVAAQQ